MHKGVYLSDVRDLPWITTATTIHIEYKPERRVVVSQESLELSRQRGCERVDRIGVKVEKPGVGKHQSDVCDALRGRPELKNIVKAEDARASNA